MTEPEKPHGDVPPEDEAEGVEEIDVEEQPEPDEPDEGELDPADDYTEGPA